MSVPNEQTLGPCWAYETVVGTAIITAADTATNYLGHWEKETKIDNPAIDWNVEQAMIYSQRQPASQAIANGDFASLTWKYFPVNPVPLYWILGKYDTAVISCLDSGTPKSRTIRFESKGGTNPHRRQMVGAFTTKVHAIAELDKDFYIEETLNYWSLEDQDDRVALTTAPVYPGAIETHYQSILSCTYNGTEKTYITRVEFALEKEINAIAKNASSQILYPGAFKPHALYLHGVWNDNIIWDDYFHKTLTSDVVLKIAKVGDATKYIQVTFTNVAWKKVTSVGQPLGGFQHSIIYGVPQSITVTCVGETWAASCP
jgi:hypothetical protein